ncbi:MAG TPA: hypothetical protein VGQ30_01955 [Gemmatimonadaceae bacterium]|jgi:hypothetical protein|nr:hypothetical protein [Gemmatimonadaceae bacterium]
MRIAPNICAVTIFLAAGASADAQTAPSTNAAVGEWGVAIVKRASEILASPAQWSHDTTGDCHGNATTFTIQCALEKAVDESAGIYPGRARGVTPANAPKTECALHPVGNSLEGSCGQLFDEMPVFTIAKVKAVTTGAWRKDARPAAVWAGTMTDAGAPVMQEARRLVDAVAIKKYSARLVGYNNDPATTFADVQKFFTLLSDRVRKQASADMGGGDNVEIELYDGGNGVIRTYNGWYAVSGLSETAATLRFMVDTVKEIAPNSLDREILERASKIITSDSVWNRADNRKCAPDANTWSIYCAEEKAMIEVTGGFHHRRPASELVRVIVDERSKGKDYSHRLMDYNNDKSTHLSDVQSLFAEAIARIKR